MQSIPVVQARESCVKAVVNDVLQCFLKFESLQSAFTRIIKNNIIFSLYKSCRFAALQEEIQKKTGYVVMRAEGVFDVDANTSIDQLSEDLDIILPEVCSFCRLLQLIIFMKGVFVGNFFASTQKNGIQGFFIYQLAIFVIRSSKN